VRWSTSSIPRASRIPASVESSKLVATLRAAAPPGRASEAEAGLRRSVGGGIRAASTERGRRSVSGSAPARASDAAGARGGSAAHEIGSRRDGFDSRGRRAKAAEEISRKREGFDADQWEESELGCERSKAM
jgi:hypothetical protein